MTLPRYIPVVGDTPAGFLVFFGVADGKPDVLHGVPATAAAATYLDGSAGVAATPPADRLGFYFRHLDAADPTVAADAFLEFARAPDADIAKAAPALDPAKLRLWLADPATPDDRLGVYGMMLGLSGGPADATWLAGLLTASPPAGRVAANFGGLLAGYTLLAPDDGWAITRHVLADPKRHYAERLSAVGTVRYFRATRPKESKDHIVSCYRAALDRPDLADMAVEDLRRWGWWELTADVLAAFDRPTHSAKLFRRGVVRYALSCPRDEAKAWVGRLRSREPELVASVEESLRQFERGGGD